MDELVLGAIIVAAWVIVFPIIVLLKSMEAAHKAEEASKKVHLLSKELAELRKSFSARGVSESLEKNIQEAPVSIPQPISEEIKDEIVHNTPPPSLPVIQAPEPETVPIQVPPIAKTPAEPKELFSLEKFMGVKLFAWLGGLAMFLGVIFFVKYAFENNLISPTARIVMGLLTGTGLIVGGWVTHHIRHYRVLGQAFCATGVVTLYGVIFAAHAVYHLALFGPVSTFVMMAMVTAVAFFSAVRLHALVVAVLGMLGGFLTPALLATGQDQVFMLFGYIALLDIGLLAVARYYKWNFLSTAAAVLTGISLTVWFTHFFNAGHYDQGPKTLIPMGLQLFFLLVFLGGGAVCRTRRKANHFDAWAVLIPVAVALLFSFAMLGYYSVADRYFLLHGFAFLVEIAVFAAVILWPRIGSWLWLLGGIAFLHLACWTSFYLKNENLVPALGIYLAFGILHAAGPFLLSRFLMSGSPAVSSRLGPWFGPVVLGIILLSLTLLPSSSISVWFAVLLIDLLVVALAVFTAAMLPVMASLFMTMLLAGVWLFKAPVAVDSQSLFLIVVTFFAAAFAFAGKKLSSIGLTGGALSSAEDRSVKLLPVFSGGLPFILLILALLRLPIENPSAVFLVAGLIALLLMALAVFNRQGHTMMVALIGVLAVEGVWYLQHFQSDAPLLPLAWYMGFYLVFLGFPFIFRKSCADLPLTWIASALAGIGHFILIYDLVKQAYPNGMMGLLPASFAIPSLLAFFIVLRVIPSSEGNHQSRLAWYGGVALLFITLIFPIQFERQWLTISWAMEGALLLWLYRRVPHPGLQWSALALLGTAFVRLTVNPAVFSAYPRSGTAIFNWHLYTYGLVAAAYFFAGKCFSDPAGRCAGYPVRGLIFAAGGILLFLLLNIEIADYFTPVDSRFIAFQFGGNFARDMAYSIAWGLFSLSLLGIGIWRRSPYARYAAIGLLAVTLLKLFFHDLAAIESIFRIGALIGVAIIAFITSFLYQRFLQEDKK